ncbi:sulfate/molybdate ABC transporter ATP-binding protein [Amnimonas aquatica]|uniref:Sulfate ABC transporter ATP-binding protein n=1 Tax=Amnimonas aquatica TaxID=2094561 RepID=A0A2P6ARD9_9GAMM|nr:sulfate ABC transporter ATP-binding protein [Amnimonas aquatica]PQA37078.1 sulfate ABC transporter ATP-binding protein [Amnimonas aquatica]
MSIAIESISKQFGNFTALNQVNLDIDGGELVALLGPSGCGKTTLLRIIAGLETPDSGRLAFHGEDTTDTPVRERQVGFVFQHYALFRHLTVFENVAFGLRVRPRKTRPSEAIIRHKVHELLQLVQLDWLADRYPSQLSGGQRQRIALARALAVEPRVLLLDEPFGALDAQVRKELRRWLRRLHDELHITSVFVTHDQEEALEVADRVVVLNRGRIEQVGAPAEVYHNPASPFVVEFLGQANKLPAQVSGGRADVLGWQLPAGSVADGQGVAYVRPSDWSLSHHAVDGSQEVTLKEVRAVGPRWQLEVVHAGQPLEIELSTRDDLGDADLTPGHALWLHPRKAHLFAGQAG